MAITNGYATLADVKARLGIETADTADDTKLENMIEGISRAIDELCCRRFYSDGSDATRYFTAEVSEAVNPGDMVALTTLATDENGDRVYERTWAATDYDLEPYNAVLDSKPYTEIAVTPQGVYSFPSGIKKGVKIVGKWGWPATPKSLNEACLLLTEKLFKRKDAIFGVVGTPGMGELKQIIKDDPEVNLLLMPYRKLDILGV